MNVIDICPKLQERAIKNWFLEDVEGQVRVLKQPAQVISYEVFEAYRALQDLNKRIEKWEHMLGK